jgi:hypothetical protein
MCVSEIIEVRPFEIAVEAACEHGFLGDGDVKAGIFILPAVR